MRRGTLATLATIGGLLALAPAASADFHLIQIREVYTGSDPVLNDDAFIELQMYSPGQTQLAMHPIRVYDADGGLPVTTFNLQNTAANGENQRSYLVGDDEVVPTPDFVNQQLGTALGNLDAGGAVCFDAIDCVSWGNFAGAGPTSPTGTPAPAMPPGQSLTRSIAPGCPTLLEAGDDTDDSATDFALTATRTPRNNATAPTETACDTGPGGGGGGGDTNPPQTTITKQPDKRTEKAKAKLKFQSSEPGSDFMCKLDKGVYKPCSSPYKKRVDLGKHKFKVFAVDQAGNEDPSPAKAKFKRIDG
jgi:hypothetical protein